MEGWRGWAEERERGVICKSISGTVMYYTECTKVPP